REQRCMPRDGGEPLRDVALGVVEPRVAERRTREPFEHSGERGRNVGSDERVVGGRVGLQRGERRACLLELVRGRGREESLTQAVELRGALPFGGGRGRGAAARVE